MAAFIMNITTGMVNIIMNRYLENNGGDYAIGAYGIISSYSIQVSMLLMGICQGMQSVIGYFYAAGHRQMTLHILQKAIRTGSLIACCGFIIGEAFAPLVGQSLYFRSDAATTQRRGAAVYFSRQTCPVRVSTDRHQLFPVNQAGT